MGERHLDAGVWGGGRGGEGVGGVSGCCHGSATVLVGSWGKGLKGTWVCVCVCGPKYL